MLIQNISISYTKGVFIITPGSEMNLVSTFQLIHNTESKSSLLVQSYFQVPYKPKITFITHIGAGTQKIISFS